MRGAVKWSRLIVPGLVVASVGLVGALASAVVCTRQAFVTQHATREEARHDLSDGTSIYVNTVRRRGYVLMGVAGPMPSHVADAFDEIRSQEIPTRSGDPRPRWLRRSAIEDPQQSSGVAAGWPFLCLWGRTDTNVNRRPQSVETGVVTLNVRGVRTRFPAMPDAIGLLGNMAFYGSMVGLPWFVMVFTRREWRTHHNRCVACGYARPQGAAVCPECGKAFGR